MKIRFRVDKSECLRRKIDWDDYTCVLNIVPTDIPDDERELIASHLNGCDIQVPFPHIEAYTQKYFSDFVVAKEPNYQALIEAIKEADIADKAKWERHSKETRDTIQQIKDSRNPFIAAREFSTIPGQLCCVCKTRPATVHLTEIHHDQMQKLDMCEECAKSKGIQTS